MKVVPPHMEPPPPPPSRVEPPPSPPRVSPDALTWPDDCSQPILQPYQAPFAISSAKMAVERLENKDLEKYEG